jgi:hypothetical protein
MAGKITCSDGEVFAIAKRQKAIIWLILLSIPAYAIAMRIPFLPVGIAIISLVFIYKLAVALREDPWMYVILGVIPCISLIALLYLNSQANSALKARRIRVGLMGANNEDLKKLNPNDCPPNLVKRPSPNPLAPESGN